MIARGHQLQRRIGIGETEGFGAVSLRAMRMNFRVNAAVDDVIEDILADEIGPGVVVFVRLADQARQPVRMAVHPSFLPAGERRVAFLGERILDAFTVKGLGETRVARQLVHAYRRATLVRSLWDDCIALAALEVASPLGRRGGHWL